MIRLVVSDVDGTMLDETELIPDKIHQLADMIRQKKILFTIASGREYSQVEKLETLLDIKIPVIMCNGTAARHRNEFSWCESIEPEIVRSIVKKADQYDMTVVLSLPDGEYAYRKTAFVEQTIKQYGRFSNILSLSNDNWSQVSVQKILIIDREGHEGFSNLKALVESYENELTYVGFGDSIDIMPKGCTKASGIKKLAGLLNIDISEVMAIGDSYNDIEMICEVGVGVAVNNAVDELKKCADYICTGIYINGVIEAIEKYCKDQEVIRYVDSQ